MFGPMNEALAKCGHWVVWDTKAPQTTGWTRTSIERADCLSCTLDRERAEFKRALATAKAFALPLSSEQRGAE